MGIKVLLAEDEKTRELVKVSLEKEGYQVLEYLPVKLWKSMKQSTW